MAALLAFKLTFPDYPEEGQQVVFAYTDSEALSEARWNSELDRDDVIEAERLPDFDQYAPGPVPVSALLKAGWALSAEELGAEVIAFIEAREGRSAVATAPEILDAVPGARVVVPITFKCGEQSQRNVDGQKCAHEHVSLRTTGEWRCNDCKFLFVPNVSAYEREVDAYRRGDRDALRTVQEAVGLDRSDETLPRVVPFVRNLLALAEERGRTIVAAVKALGITDVENCELPEAIAEWVKDQRERVVHAPERRLSVLKEVAAERERQDAKWGDVAELKLLDGTGRSFDREHLANVRDIVSMLEHERRMTFSWVLREEVAEAVAESDPKKLRAELVQVAAVAVKWIEAIDRR